MFGPLRLFIAHLVGRRAQLIGELRGGQSLGQELFYPVEERARYDMILQSVLQETVVQDVLF